MLAGPSADRNAAKPPAGRWDAGRALESMLAALPEDTGRFQHLCGGVADWETLFTQARAHGVAGVLWHHLARPDVRASPQLKKEAARSLGFERLAQTRLRAALDEALQALGDAGVRSAALKGPLLGDRVYPAPSLRPTTDIDLLVAPAQLDRSIAALEGIGYRGAQGALERWYRENHHHLHFTRPQTPMLELHFRATTGFGTVVPAEEFLSRAVPYRAGAGSAAWVLSPEDELIYLGVHAARHLFEALFWLYDLKLFILRYAGLDWALAAARADALGVKGALALTFEVLQRRLAVSLPQSAAFTPHSGLLQMLAERALAATQRLPKPSRREAACRTLYRALLCDRPAWSVWSFRHRLVRFARRRAHACLPWLFPEAWSR
jgi:hypothetical protein